LGARRQLSLARPVARSFQFRVWRSRYFSAFSPVPDAPLRDPSSFPYATHLDVLFPALATIDLDPLVAAVRDSWYNQTLVRVNESVVRLGVMQGEYHWHKHDADDEFFYVVAGRFLIDLEPESDGVTPGRIVELAPRQGFVVP
jgi:hypothetical protein